jgi:hypothetical protein
MLTAACTLPVASLSLPAIAGSVAMRDISHSQSLIDRLAISGDPLDSAALESAHPSVH